MKRQNVRDIHRGIDVCMTAGAFLRFFPLRLGRPR
jgi:hypothetical protein